MYKRIARTITSAFVNNGTISEDKSNIYAYGFEVLISTIAYTTILIGIAAITKTLLESFLFWLGFFIVRTIAGGYHAETYITCHILFLCSHLSFIAFLKLVPSVSHEFFIIAFAGISSIVLFLIAPVDHPNKRFTINEYKRYKKCSFTYAILFVTITTVMLVYRVIDLSLLLSFVIGTLIATLSVISAKIVNKKEGRINHEENPNDC